ncbi:hypothetical protein BJY54_002092 [Streptomyces nodosus]|nr:hypothetical protein [Streptomyces nodosus]
MTSGDPTPGLKTLTEKQIEAFACSANVFLRDSGIPDVRDLVRVHEIGLPDVGADPLKKTAPDLKPFVVMYDGTVGRDPPARQQRLSLGGGGRTGRSRGAVEVRVAGFGGGGVDGGFGVQHADADMTAMLTRDGRPCADSWAGPPWPPYSC